MAAVKKAHREIVSVHAAVLHDALQKASKVAPTKGAAFDRAAGIHLTVLPDGIAVRATDEELFYYQKVEAFPTETGMSFRLPSVLLSGFVASLPMNNDAHMVRFMYDEENDPRSITIKFGKTKLSLRASMIVGGNFPTWEPEPYESMTSAQEIAATIEQVAWAVGESGVLQGVHIDGEQMVGTNGQALAAIAPCKVPIDTPITAVLKPIMPLLKMGTDIRIKVIENKIHVALDDQTQIRSTVVLLPYPDVVKALSRSELPSSFLVTRTRLIEALNRLLLVNRNDNLPRCKITIREGSIEVSLTGEKADIQDATMVAGQTFHEDHTYTFNPYWVVDVLESFTCKDVRINHLVGYPTKTPFHLTDPGGAYQAWIMPMSDTVS